MKKNQLLETIQLLPEDFDLEELIEKLLIIQKIEEGQEQITAGKYLDEEQAKLKLEKWLK